MILRVLSPLVRRVSMHSLLSARSCLLAFLLSMLLGGAFVGCGGSFPGQLPPKPSWVVGDRFIPRGNAPHRQAVGSVRGQLYIELRRREAQEAAFQALMDELYRDFDAQLERGPAPDRGVPPLPMSARSQLRSRLQDFSWSRLVSIPERFFDASVNRQYSLALLLWSDVEQALQEAPLEAGERADLRAHLTPLFSTE